MRFFSNLKFGISFRALGPLAQVSPTEAIRSGLGAFLGLLIATVIAYCATNDAWPTFYLIAPFGATAVLLFAAPNSPLAQPWPAIMGNTVSAIIALAVCHFISEPILSIPLSVGLAIVAMGLVRATHPPGGAVAMTVALGAETILPQGFSFALSPVALGTFALVVCAMIYARLTGRHYPLRTFGEPNSNKTTDITASERLGLSEEELTNILARHRQSLNLGVKDLARLIGAAEMQAASHHVGYQTAGGIMSRDLVTVSPTTSISEVANLFIQHGFTSLPVVNESKEFVGLIFQRDLISADILLYERRNNRIIALFKCYAKPAKRISLQASDIMNDAPATATIKTPISILVQHLALNGQDAVAILDDKNIVGVVTQTDLIAELARETLRSE